MLGNCLENVRKKNPLVCNITNYVTVNDVANVLLACGGSPIMTDEPDDLKDIVTICSGLNINIGTLNRRSIEGMFTAGKRAQEKGIPVLLDPVGAGASPLRTETAIRITEEIKPVVIRGNISEIKAVSSGAGSTKGVDADVSDAVTADNLEKTILFAKELAARTGAVTVITGARDLVADREKCFVIENGRPEMSRITGTGCMLSGMMTAFIAANPGCITEAAAAAVCVMGIAGEIGLERLLPGEGNASYRNRIIDAIYNMDAETLEKRAKYEVY